MAHLFKFLILHSLVLFLVYYTNAASVKLMEEADAGAANNEVKVNDNVNKAHNLPSYSFNNNGNALRKKPNEHAANARPKLFGPGNPDQGGMAADTSKVKKRKPQMHISETPECADDVHRFCSDHASSSNFLILDCLQNDEKTHDKVTDICQNFLWEFKKNLTLNDGFDRASNRDCGAELAQFKDCRELPQGKGMRIPCLMEHYEEVSSKTCKNFLNKMGSIIFSDYRFLHTFMTDCTSDIATLKCGHLELFGADDDAPHSQGRTVECLNRKRKEIQSKQCKHSLRRVNEMSSDDFHHDRPLYYACKEDREEFCEDVKAGGGAVYNCLMKKIDTNECREQLELRQQEIAEDVKVDKMFYDSCKADIKENQCSYNRANANDDIEEDLSRSTILLCLENAEAEGKKVRPDCLKQMFQLRSVLMQDYKVSPELVSACQKEITELCDGLEPDGETLECLMKEIVEDKKKEFGAQCTAQVSKLLNIANVGEDIRLDKPLQKACGDVVTSACSDLSPGQGAIITCLLENIDHEDMTDECEDHLLRIQYFAVRDFKLDHHLFSSCKRDAKKLCHTNEYENPRNMAPESGPLVFACLHRHFKHNDPSLPKLSKPCNHEVRRVLKERSSRVKLMPKVEEACMVDLSDFCSDDDEHKAKGGEMECLQTNLEDLSDKCREVVASFTEEASENLEMDHILMKACTPMITKFCKDKLDDEAMPSDVLDCLIEFKNSYGMDDKCSAGIEHHQLISLKDFRFNHKFRKNCQEAVSSLCQNKNTKYEVVACLSEHVRNDTLMEKDHRVNRPCRKELRFELLQRGENINLDPELKKQCSVDVAKLCKNITPGKAEVLECLRSHKKKLSENCHKMIFKREQDQAINGDYALLHTCKGMIKRYCEQFKSEEEILDCLKEHRDSLGFDEPCKKIVMRRQVEQAHDYRLSPHLQKACRMDIPKYCAHVFEKRKPGDNEMEGKIINCLKKQYTNKEKSLSNDCEHEIKSLIKEASLDINQNPIIVKMCKKDIHSLCLDKIQNIQQMEIEYNDEIIKANGHGSVIECLKSNLRNIKDISCKKEVAMMVVESRVDIHVDPLLHSACQQDLLSLCHIVKPGLGRQMSCLLSYLDTDAAQLSRNCLGMLKRRKDLWEYSAQVAPPENFFEVAEQISASPARNYFLAVMFTAIGIIFIVGITCGRVTKRVRAEVKNR